MKGPLLFSIPEGSTQQRRCKTPKDIKGDISQFSGLDPPIKSSPFEDRVLFFAVVAQAHWQREKKLLAYNYRVLILGLVFQYLHNVATNVAYYLHIPREPLDDVGFYAFPPISRNLQIFSDVLFCAMLLATVFFIFSPFLVMRGVYATQMLARFVGVCVLAQSLRVITFLVTTLPGPNYHCRPDSPEYNPPKRLIEIFVRQNGFRGCGDLVFSSHAMFVVLCALTVQRYSDNKWLKRVWWTCVVVLGGLVVAARKHYTLDIVVAWYTVPLIWIAYEYHFPDKLPAEFEFDDTVDPEDIIKNDDSWFDDRDSNIIKKHDSWFDDRDSQCQQDYHIEVAYEGANQFGKENQFQFSDHAATIAYQQSILANLSDSNQANLANLLSPQ